MVDFTPGWYSVSIDGYSRTGLLDDVGDFSYLIDGTHTTEFESPLTDARPLTVLELLTDDRWRPSRLVRDLRRMDWGLLADQIEAQTKLARTDEPGLYGIVEASCDHLYDRGPWVCDELGWARIGLSDIRTHNHDGWDDLIDPVLIREGME